jgi:hypothetical protein
LRVHLVTEEAIYFQGMIGVGSMDCAQEVAVYLALCQTLPALHHLVEGICPSLIESGI